MSKISTLAADHETVTSLVRAQKSQLLKIAAPGNNASHDRAWYGVWYADGTSETLVLGLRAACDLEEAGYRIKCLSTITD